MKSAESLIVGPWPFSFHFVITGDEPGCDGENLSEAIRHDGGSYGGVFAPAIKGLPGESARELSDRAYSILEEKLKELRKTGF